MITIVMPYYENGGMMERHLQEWQSYAPEVKEQFRAVIVDDGSEKDPAIEHMDVDTGFPVDLYRIKQNIPWNIPGARNLGMNVALDAWCLLTDIDHLLEADQARQLVDSYLDLDGDYYTFARRWPDGRLLHPHPNSYLLQRHLYWEIGGCDEDFSGYWGADEQGFRKRLKQDSHQGFFDWIYLTHFGRDDIPDASTREWGRRGTEWDWTRRPELVKKAAGPAYKPVNPLRFEWERVL